MPFRVLTLDDAEWDSVVSEAGAPIFYSRAYCRFRLDPSVSRALLLLLTTPKGTVFDVTYARKIQTLPFFSSIASEMTMRPIDLASPEYNGPILMCEDSDRDELLAQYRQAVMGFCAQNSVVTEFIRFHPFRGVGPQLGATAAASVIYVDLRQGCEAAQRSYRKGHKSTIKKAEREGASARFAQSSEAAVRSLARLHEQTMRERCAKSVDYRSEEFFCKMFGILGEDAVLVEAYTGSELVSASVFLRSANELWYLYSGSIQNLLKTGAQTFALDKTIQWAAAQGLEYVVLGSGAAPGDSLYLYKTGFSHLTAETMHLKVVHNAKLMRYLCEAKAKYNQAQLKPVRTDYFPSYWLD